MGWKAIGKPVVRKQRERFVVRIDGVDTETGRRLPRQLGTYPSRRAAGAAAREALVEGRSGSGDRNTLSWLLRRWLASRTDVSQKGREQYGWAIGHIESGLGAVRLDQLYREDIARWMNGLADGGHLSRRSIQIMRTVLRAALSDAVEEGLLHRSPAARVALPKHVAKPMRSREARTWNDREVEQFLATVRGHRWGAPLRVAVLYGLRRSELLALRWNDFDEAGGMLRVDEGLVAVGNGMVWTDGKSERSRRRLALDPDTIDALVRHRQEQLDERREAGPAWEDHELIVATRTGRPVIPRNFDRSLRLLVDEAGIPRLTSHGLRHTAATHMVRNASDVGELRAAAEILGHSPDMLMRIYAHTLPESVRTVTDKIGQRARATTVTDE